MFALLGALGIGWLGRRGRHDVATALALVVMLGLGALFLSFSTRVRAGDLLAAVRRGARRQHQRDRCRSPSSARCASRPSLVLYRPLLLSSVMPELAEARGVRPAGWRCCFLVVVALATSMTLPVVGALLIFSLMIGPPAAARSVTSRPLPAMALSVVIALVTVWAVDRRLLRDELAGRASSWGRSARSATRPAAAGRPCAGGGRTPGDVARSWGAGDTGC